MQGFKKVVRKVKKKPAAKPARKEARNQGPAPATAIRNGPGDKVAKSQGGQRAAQGTGATKKKMVSYNNNCKCTTKFECKMFCKILFMLLSFVLKLMRFDQLVKAIRLRL